MSVKDKSQLLAYQFLKVLVAKREEDPTLAATLDDAIRGISSVYGVELSSAADFSCLNYLLPLQDIFDAGVAATKAQTYQEAVTKVEANPKWPPFLETVVKKKYFDGVEEGSVDYMKRHSKVLVRFQDKLDETLKKAPAGQKVEMEKEAEAKKTAGNDAITNKDYNAAVRFYTEAIELTPDGPNSHIYYSNRAAAHCYLQSFELAIEDCEKCVQLSPTYVKGYTRLGLAHYSIGNFEASIEAYKKCIELEPKVKGHKDALSNMKQKMVNI